MSESKPEEAGREVVSRFRCKDNYTSPTKPKGCRCLYRLGHTEQPHRCKHGITWWVDEEQRLRQTEPRYAALEAENARLRGEARDATAAADSNFESWQKAELGLKPDQDTHARHEQAILQRAGRAESEVVRLRGVASSSDTYAENVAASLEAAEERIDQLEAQLSRDWAHFNARIEKAEADLDATRIDLGDARTVAELRRQERDALQADLAERTREREQGWDAAEKLQYEVTSLKLDAEAAEAREKALRGALEEIQAHSNPDYEPHRIATAALLAPGGPEPSPV